MSWTKEEIAEANRLLSLGPVYNIDIGYMRLLMGSQLAMETRLSELEDEVQKWTSIVMESDPFSMYDFWHFHEYLKINLFNHYFIRCLLLSDDKEKRFDWLLEIVPEDYRFTDNADKRVWKERT